MKLNDVINETTETRKVADKKEKNSSYDFLKSVDDSTIDQLFDSILRETETTEDEASETETTEGEVNDDVDEVDPETLPESVETIEHVVQPGDTLYARARSYKVSVREIVDANKLSNPDRLAIGSKLLIPQPGE